MRNYETVEGEDYIVDYYAVLGIDRFSGTDTVRKAFRKMIKENHPDIVDRASDDIKAKARAKTELAERAKAKLLSGEDVRKEYDALFEKFDETHISKSGAEMMIVGGKGETKLHLLSMAQGENMVDKKIKSALDSMAGFDPKIFKRIEQMYLALEEPDEELEEDYKRLVERKMIYDNLNEKFLWLDAGVENIPELNEHMVDPEEIVERRLEFIKEVPELVAESTDVLLLENDNGGLKLLEGSISDSNLAVSDPEKIKTVIVEKALQHFDAHKDTLEENARTRAENITKMLGFIKWEYVGERKNTKRVAILVSNGDGKFIALFTFIPEKNELKLEEAVNLMGQPLQEVLGSLDFLAEFGDAECDVILMHLLDVELDFMIQVAHVASKHGKQFETEEDNE